MKIIELGCGIEKFQAPNLDDVVVRVDWNPRLGPDVVHDLENFPYPFDDNEFDMCHSSHCVEHISRKTDLFREIHRIVKPQGRVEIIVPHFTSWQAYNYDHVSFWNTGGMGCFENADWYGVNYPKFRVLKTELRWRGPRSTKGARAALNRFISHLANLKPGFAERYWYVLVGGFGEVRFVMEVVK